MYQSFCINHSLVLSSYDEGRHSKPWSGGDWNDFIRGRDDKKRWDDANSAGNNKGNKGPQIDGGSGGGNNCLGPLILIILGLYIVVQSLVAGLLGGTILYILNKPFDLLHTDKKYKSEFAICAILSFIYLASGAVLNIIQLIFFGKMIGVREFPGADSFYKFFLQGDFYSYLSLDKLFTFHILCTFFTYFLFSLKLKEVLSPKYGFLKFIILITTIILPSIFISSFIFYEFANMLF